MTKINGREYEWADLTLILGGRDITGFRGLKYGEKIEREALHAKGRYPHSIQSGNVTFEGEITLLRSEYDALVKAGGGSILGLCLAIPGYWIASYAFKCYIYQKKRHRRKKHFRR